MNQLRLFAQQEAIGVVVLDADRSTFDTVRRRLRRAAPKEYSVRYASTVNELAALVDAGDADIAVLGIDADDPGQLDRLGRIRTAHIDVPVVVLHHGTDPALGFQAVVTGAQDVLALEDANGARLHRLLWAAIARKRAEQAALASAFADPVTGLGTRHWMMRRLADAVSHAEESNGEWEAALLFLDLDRFKLVNDTLGHAAGDELLRLVAGRLRAVVRTQDPIARFGGDEFVILVEGHRIEGLTHRIALRALAAFAEPFTVEGQPFSIFASMGLALLQRGEDVDSFVDRADVALYRAKRRGRNRIVAYDDDLAEWASSEQDLADEVAATVRDDSFALELHAVWDLRLDRRVGFDVSGRWAEDHERREPLESLAERNGLGPDLGRALIERTLGLAASDELERGVGTRWWIQVPAGLLPQPTFVGWLTARCQHYGVDPSALVVSVGEGELADPDLVTAPIQQLADQGVTVAMRGFGVGTSSLTRFASADIDEVHLSAELCRGAAGTPARLAVIESLARLANAVGQHLVAGGPLEPDDVAAVGSVGCHFAIVEIDQRAAAIDLTNGVEAVRVLT